MNGPHRDIKHTQVQCCAWRLLRRGLLGYTRTRRPNQHNNGIVYVNCATSNQPLVTMALVTRQPATLVAIGQEVPVQSPIIAREGGFLWCTFTATESDFLFENDVQLELICLFLPEMLYKSFYNAYIKTHSNINNWQFLHMLVSCKVENCRRWTVNFNKMEGSWTSPTMLREKTDFLMKMSRSLW